jgi:hypothetical protein
MLKPKVVWSECLIFFLNNKERGISFDSKLGDADFKNLTGLDKVSFDDILTYLTSVRDTQVRSARTCLGIFMTKLKKYNYIVIQETVKSHRC